MAIPDNALFRRDWRVIVDRLDVSNLDIEFKIKRTLKKEPNPCVLTVWNLSDTNRASLLKRNKPITGSGTISGVHVEIEAGYVGHIWLLFSGDSRDVSSGREDIDVKTTISADDGGRAYREARINKSFQGGTSVATIVKECANAMRIGLGNVANYEQDATIAALGNSIPGSGTFTPSGSAADQLDRILKSTGLTWSIQGGALQVLAKGKALGKKAGEKAIVLSPNTGLIGSPKSCIDATVSLGDPQQFKQGAKQTKAKAIKPKDPTIIKLKSLLIPGLTPGRQIDLQSSDFNGPYFVTEVEYTGQTFGDEWSCELVARKQVTS
jgi:hypothetical protein